jgi:integrase
LSERAKASLWETMYLGSEELSELLDFVRDADTRAFVYPMTTFITLTGCRRSEMLRSRLDDWDLENRLVLIREKKRDRSVTFTTRDIDVHPRLAEVMAEWVRIHPGGQHTITENGVL